jgi:molybdopterin-guanine dinucleotide biosynthesis protein A
MGLLTTYQTPAGCDSRWTIPASVVKAYDDCMTPSQSAFGVGGIVLCGGQSTRMGRPKAWLPVGDELMLQRVVRVLSGVVDPVVVVASTDQDLPPIPDNVRVARDARPDRGPLEGMAAGLHALSGQADAVYVSSCDVPLLRPAFVRRMIELLGAHLIAVPAVGGRRHPLAGVYRLDVLPTLQELLKGNRLAMLNLLKLVPPREVSADELRDVDPDLESLRNVNTPQQYGALSPSDGV